MEGVEVFPVLIGPGLSRGLAHQVLQLGVAAGAGELDHVHLGQFVEVQEFVVDPVLQAVVLGGDQPCDGAGDADGVEVLEHRHPLVPLLDVELVEEFIGGHRVADALVQMGVAEHRPLGGKLGVHLQQGHEVGGKGGVAAAGLGAHNALAGHVHQAQGLGGHNVHVHQNIVQHRQVGALAPGHMGAVILLACFEGKFIFVNRHS